MDSLNEESTSLKPQILESKTVQDSGPTSIRLLHYSREKRLDSVRLSPVYYITWILLINVSVVIPFYEWFFIQEPECWSARYGHIIASVLFAMLTAAVASLLCFLNCVTRVSVSYWRLNFCTLCFIFLTILSIINFLLGIFYFSLNTCYFSQITPAESITADSNWFHTFTLKYDLKVVGIFHLLCCLFAFITGIGFAIIKNNFKYIRQFDFD